MHLILHAVAGLVLLLCTAAVTNAAGRANMVFPDDAVVNVVERFGLVGDGETDNTAAMGRMFDEMRGSLQTLYFPDGTYLISDSVGIFGGKSHSRDRFLALQGQSEEGTIIRLKDGADGFDDAEKPKIVLSLYEGQSTGDVMHTYVRDLTVDVGAGNPGAAGLRFMTNNTGAMERVTIRSSDPEKRGAIGLDLRQGQNGPGLIKNVTVDGFDAGAKTGDTFSLVFDGLTLRDQRKVGFDNPTGRLTFGNLTIEGAPLAFRNGKHADLTIVGGTFTASAEGAAEAAMRIEGTQVFLRDVATEGFAHTVQGPGDETHDLAADAEWSPLPFYALFDDAPKGTLRLPIRETPEVPWETDLDKWVRIDLAEGRDVTEQIQRKIDEAAAAGKTTIYFPHSQQYAISKPIRVHGSINRIIGMGSLVDVKNKEAFGDKAVFTFEDLDSDVIVVERFFILGGWEPARVYMFDNKSDAEVVLKNAGISGMTKKPAPGKTWFIEDVAPDRLTTLEIVEGETVYARQWNPEARDFPLMKMDGGTLWVLGLKTEGRTEHLIARNGAKAEILGGVAYQSWDKQPRDPPMFVIEDSDVSLTLGFYHHDLPFETIVKETRDGETKTLRREELKLYHLPLYRAVSGP